MNKVVELSPGNSPFELPNGLHQSAIHEFEAVLCPEDEGGFSVFALHYPGVISQGETLEEAKMNIAEAFLAVLESRRKHGEAMEFSQRPTVDITPECQRIRVTFKG